MTLLIEGIYSMRYFKAIVKMLYSSWKHRITAVIIFILLFVVQHFVTESFLMEYTSYYDLIGEYKSQPWDAVLYEANEIEVARQFSEDNIEDIIYQTIPSDLSGIKYKYKNNEYFPSGSERTNTSGYFGGTLKDFVRIVIGDMIIKKDNRLLEEPGTILLSDNIAAKIGADVGDEIYIQCPENTYINPGQDDYKVIHSFDGRKEYPFKVAAIYRYKVFPWYVAVISAEDIYNIHKDNYNDEIEEHSYERGWRAYIQFKDKDLGMQELKKYIPCDPNMFVQYYENWREHVSSSLYENYDEYAKRWLMMEPRYSRYDIRTEELAYREWESVVDTKTIVITAAVISLVFAVMFFIQNYRVMKLNYRGFGIMSACGMPGRVLFMYGALSTLLRQLSMMAISFLLLYGYQIFGKYPESGYNFCRGTLIGVYVPLLLSAVLSAILSGIVSYVHVSKKHMTEALSAEN